jgi:DNA polymerase IV
MSERIIAHLDMDAFYASVELLRYPALRGLPVVVGGRRRQGGNAETFDGDDPASIPRLRGYVGRGVITTATYEARALGVHSGMGLMKAARLAPDALLLPADFDRYRHYSRLFKDAVREFTPLIEDRGIDEIYLDLTQASAQRAQVQREEAQREDGQHPDGQPVGDAHWRAAAGLAHDIQRAVRAATGLSCSLGITPNKLLSKIASELDKPGGITVLGAAEIAPRIWPLAARRINGIGPKAATRLDALDIRTIGDLARADPALLIGQFGRSFGAWMHEAAHGRDERPVVTFRDPKSISRETTFERDLHPVRDRQQLSAIFTELCVRLAADLERKGYAGKTVGLKLRFEDFRQVTRDCTLDRPTQDARQIRRAAGESLKRVELDRRIRLLGVRIGALVPAASAIAGRPGDGTLTAPADAPGASGSLFD